MSNIIIKRLIVISHEGKHTYNETFRKGINIIRGSNGSGKSTICDFIYFILGGDFQNWKKEASECKDVYAEVEFDGVLTSIRREISSARQKGMYIFEGGLNDALKNYYEGWKLYPYKKTVEKTSFSNYIFNLLNFPEIKTGDADTNLTLHQILRLLYIDQESPSLSFFKFEQLFDSSLTRITIEELLFGTYDDTLYEERLQLKRRKKDAEEQEKEIKSIRKTFNSIDGQYQFEKIDEEISNLNKQIEGIDMQVKAIYENEDNSSDDGKQSIVFEIQNELTPLKQRIVEYQDKKYNLNFEVEDSKDFIQVLQGRVNSITQSLRTRELLGAIHIQFCPNCYNPLSVSNNTHGQCYVCKNDITEEEEVLHISRMKQEAILQIEESQRIIKRKISEINTLENELIICNKLVKSKQEELNMLLVKAKSTNQEQIERYILNKGKLIATVEFLTKYSKMFKYFQALTEENLKTKTEIIKLESAITNKEDSQRKRQNIVRRAVQDFAKQILIKDTENEFNSLPMSISYSAEFNNYKFNDRLNYSASSNVILKNAIRFALFFASCSENAGFMRFPRFILCDNIEDKGMQEARSQNFQRMIVALANTLKIDFQIIFSTSMIAPDLNKPEYCVGEFYTKDNKALKQ